MIQAHPNLKGLFSVNDGGSMGSLAAIDSSGKDIKLTSVDGAPEAVAAIGKPGSKFIETSAQYPADMVRIGLGIALAKKWGANVPKEIPIDVKQVTRPTPRRSLVSTPPRAMPEQPMDPILTLSGITKGFPGVRALSSVDLSVRPGEIHALLGENGAGKSTLMKILSGIYQPDEGRLVIDGQERRLNNYGDAVAAGIGTVFQKFSLIPYLNAPENIFLGRELRRFGLLARGAMRRAAASLFERLGIKVDLGIEVRRLSVAQQQFIEIAKALSVDARILILDEPTATLTPPMPSICSRSCGSCATRVWR